MTFWTRTTELHSATCKECGHTFSSTDADHVAEWMVRHQSEGERCR